MANRSFANTFAQLLMKELGISRLIDSRILPDDQEEITTGEAIEGMTLNGLGFSDRTISLTSQFF